MIDPSAREGFTRETLISVELVPAGIYERVERC